MANILPLALQLLITIAAGRNAGMARAQSPPPNSSSSSCSASLLSLAPCLAFLQGGPNATPTQGCCTALASVVNTNAACLCQLFTSSNNSLGISINQTRALVLPGACKITTPPLSQCKSPAVSNPPAAAPSSPTPVVSSPTPTANSPAISAAPPPSTTTPASVGAVSPSGSSHEGPTASTNAGSMMAGMSMLINVVGMMGVSMYIIIV